MHSGSTATFECWSIKIIDMLWIHHLKAGLHVNWNSSQRASINIHKCQQDFRTPINVVVLRVFFHSCKWEDKYKYSPLKSYFDLIIKGSCHFFQFFATLHKHNFKMFYFLKIRFSIIRRHTDRYYINHRFTVGHSTFHYKEQNEN